MENIPINTIMAGKLKEEIKDSIGEMSEYEQSIRKVNPNARDDILKSINNLEDAYNKLGDLSQAIEQDRKKPKLRDVLNIPSQLTKGSLDQKTIPHESMKKYDHSLEGLRDIKDGKKL